jgi:hypothetical protein
MITAFTIIPPISKATIQVYCAYEVGLGPGALVSHHISSHLISLVSDRASGIEPMYTWEIC